MALQDALAFAEVMKKFKEQVSPTKTQQSGT